MTRLSWKALCLFIVGSLVTDGANAQITGGGVPAGAEVRAGIAAEQQQQQPDATRLPQPQLEAQQLPPEERLQQQQLDGALEQQRALQQPDELRREQILQPPQPPGALDGAADEAMRGELGVFTVSSPGPGVEITRVAAGSAAEQAGLRPGDTILQINGRGVMSPTEVQRTIRQMPAGQTASLQVWREGATQDVNVTLQAARDPYTVGYRTEAPGVTANNALEQRTMRLEQQLQMVVQELQSLQQQMTQLQTQLAERPAPFEAPATRDPATVPPPAEPETDLFEEPTPPEPAEPPPAEPEDEPVEEPVEQPDDDDFPFEF